MNVIFNLNGINDIVNHYAGCWSLLLYSHGQDVIGLASKAEMTLSIEPIRNWNFNHLFCDFYIVTTSSTSARTDDAFIIQL